MPSYGHHPETLHNDLPKLSVLTYFWQIFLVVVFFLRGFLLVWLFTGKDNCMEYLSVFFLSILPTPTGQRRFPQSAVRGRTRDLPHPSELLFFKNLSLLLCFIYFILFVSLQCWLCSFWCTELDFPLIHWFSLVLWSMTILPAVHLTPQRHNNTRRNRPRCPNWSPIWW